MKETLKQAGYIYIRYLGHGEHVLENIRAKNPTLLRCGFQIKIMQAMDSFTKIHIWSLQELTA